MASEAFEAIVDDFDFLDEWEDRYRYVIDLGRAMEPIEEELRTEWSKVEGCASQVWIVPQLSRDARIADVQFPGRQRCNDRPRIDRGPAVPLQRTSGLGGA